MKPVRRKHEAGFIFQAVLITALSCPLPKLFAIASRRPVLAGDARRPIHSSETIMKKYLAIPAAIACLLAGPAHAQSSVTLYGTIDAGLDYISNQKSPAGAGPAYGVQSGNVSTSRWGLRGNEDLGGGLGAVFTLENGFNGANGKFGNGATSSAARRGSACRAADGAR